MHACAGGNGKQMFGDAWWLLVDALPAVGADASKLPAPAPSPSMKTPAMAGAPASEQVCNCQSHASILHKAAA